MESRPHEEQVAESIHARAEAALGFEDDETARAAPTARWADEAHEQVEAGSVTGKLLTRK
jgi:hypothetical protein